MYAPGNNPPPTRPQPPLDPAAIPSRPGPSFTPSPAFPPAQPAHQAPRQNWFFRHRVLACLVGLSVSVIIGGIAGLLATLGHSGGGGGLPGGISSTKCQLVWEGNNGNGQEALYPTYNAAYASEAAYYGAGNVPANWMPAQVPEYTLTAGSTVNVGSISVAFYDKSGKEIYADADNFNVNETLTPGQPYTGTQESYGVSNENQNTGAVSTNVASCQVVGWSPPS